MAVLDLVATFPLLILAYYAFHAGPRALENRLLGAVGLLWAAALATAALSTGAPWGSGATDWSRVHAYVTLLLAATLVHFVLVFPYRHRWIRWPYAAGVLYAGVLAAILTAWLAPDRLPLMAHPVMENPVLRLVVASALAAAMAVLALRYVIGDLEITRRRVLLLLYGLGPFMFYRLAGDAYAQATGSAEILGTERAFWELTLASDAVGLALVALPLVLLFLGTRGVNRRRECLRVAGAALVGLAAGALDAWLAAQPGGGYPSTAFVWPILAVGFFAHSVVKYQRLGEDRPLQRGARTGIRIALSLAGIGVVALLTFDVLAHSALATRLVSATLVAALAAYPFLRAASLVTDRFLAQRPAPGPDAVALRRLEVYRARLEGALQRGPIGPIEQDRLARLRQELHLSTEDHERLEQEIRARMVNPTP